MNRLLKPGEQLEEDFELDVLENTIDISHTRSTSLTKGELFLTVVHVLIFLATIAAILFVSGILGGEGDVAVKEGTFDTNNLMPEYSNALAMTLKLAMLGIILSKLATVVDAVGYILLVIGKKRKDPRDVLGHGATVPEDFVVNSGLFLSLGIKLAVFYEVLLLVGVVGVNLLFGML